MYVCMYVCVCMNACMYACMWVSEMESTVKLHCLHTYTELEILVRQV